MRVLLIEDDTILGAAVRDQIAAEGHSVDWVTRLDAARDHIGSAAYDLLLLDLMLPDGRGIGLLRDLRTRGNVTPVIILTAMDQLSDRIEGLNAGADDYLVKPFAFPELLARLRALGRRSLTAVKTNNLQTGELILDVTTRSARRGERAIELSIREYALLEYLMRNAGRPVSRSNILQAVWSYDYDGASNVVDVYVGYLRRKIDGPGEAAMIQTVRGIGYKLAG